MPAKSVAQQRLMLAAAHTRGGFGGVPEKVGKEFIGKDGKAASIAAGVIHIAPDGQILLLRRSATETNYANYWSLPGGKADGKETAEEAADREAKEEIGSIPEGDLEVIDVKLTPNGMVFYTFAKSVKEAFAPTLNDEHSGYVWTVPELAPAHRTEHAFALFYTGTVGSGALSPILYGFLGDALGPQWATVATAGTALAIFPLAFALAPYLVPEGSALPDSEGGT